MGRDDSFKKTFMLGKIESKRIRWQRMRWLDGVTNYGHELEQTLRDGEGEESLACHSSWGHKESDTT